MLDTSSEVDLREIQCELNVLSRPDGSIILSQGNYIESFAILHPMWWTFWYLTGDTVVTAGVYGPVECKLQNSDIYKAAIEVNFGTKSGITSVRERYRESLIKQTCEAALLVNMYPRDLISINVQEMQDSGGVSVSF